jgi:hypothetical protein
MRCRSLRAFGLSIACWIALATPARLAADASVTRPRDGSGIHKGLAHAEPGGKADALNLMCEIDLSYALWTLLNEPVQDFLFKWKACKPEEAKVPALGMTFKEVKREFPQLAKELDDLAPLNVMLRATLHFYEEESGGKAFARGVLDINPDLYARSGKAETFSVPESPNWNDWFKEFDSWAPETSMVKDVYGERGERCSTLCPKAESTVGAACRSENQTFTRTACNCNESARRPYATLEYTCGDGKGLSNAFRRANRIEVLNLTVTEVTWKSFDAVIRTVLAARDKERREAAQKEKSEDFWGAADDGTVFAQAAVASSTSSAATARKARSKANDKFTGPQLNRVVRDASNGESFGIGLSEVEALTASVDGAAQTLTEPRVALGAGKHRVVLHGPGSRFTFEADCGEHEMQGERPCSERPPPNSEGKSSCREGQTCMSLRFAYCDEIEQYFTYTQRSCALSDVKLELRR